MNTVQSNDVQTSREYSNMTGCREHPVLSRHEIHGLDSPQETGIEPRHIQLYMYSIPHQLILVLSLLVAADDLEVLQAMSQLLTS